MEAQNPHKRFVRVRADHEIGGRIIPIKFREEDGDSIRIDQILDVREAPSLKAGGQGVRYTCRVQNEQFYLFHDRDDWFVELP